MLKHAEGCVRRSWEDNNYCIAAVNKGPCKRLETCISMWKERVGGLKRVPLNRPRIEQF
jgi:hypothetical protein